MARDRLGHIMHWHWSWHWFFFSSLSRHTISSRHTSLCNTLPIPSRHTRVSRWGVLC